MPTVKMKNGEFKEIPADEMKSFLEKNRDLIQNRYSDRKRPIKRSESLEAESTNIK